MRLIKKTVRVEWVELGEGLNGDYDPEDPEDKELLRFDVTSLSDGEWSEVPDASYCTMMPVDAPPYIRMAKLSR